MRKIIIIFIFIFVLVLFVAVLTPMIFKKMQFSEKPRVDVARPFVVINGKRIFVTLAQTQAAQERGLSGRDSLPEDEGMLFLFSREGNYPFWMKDMKFPIDIVWINNGKIVWIEQNVRPEPGVSDDALKIYLPSEVASAVLEVNAGKIAEWQAGIGDKVSFNF